MFLFFPYFQYDLNALFFEWPNHQHWNALSMATWAFKQQRIGRWKVWSRYSFKIIQPCSNPCHVTASKTESITWLKTDIPQCCITADTLTPPPPIKRVAGCGERELERSLWHHFYPIRAQSKSSRPDQQRLLCGTVHDPLLHHVTKHPKPDHQPN